MRRSAAAVAGALAVLTLAACGDSTGPGGVSSVGAATMSIRNGTDRTIWFIQTRRCGSDQWSQDLLGSGSIRSGESFERALPGGCHDVRLRTDPAVGRQTVWSGLDFGNTDNQNMTLDSWRQIQ